MDSSDSHDSSSATTSSNGENDKNDSTMIQSKRADIFSTYQRQDFSLPDSVMFYITKNPTTPELYQKIIQTCKDFFVKYPILVVPFLGYEINEWRFSRKFLNLDNLTSKFWITSEFRVRPYNFINNKDVIENLASSVTSKIFRCDVKRLTLNVQILSFDDLCILIPNAEEIYIDNVTVTGNDGSIVGIEKIVEVAVKAKLIHIQNPPITSVTSSTVKELVKIPYFCKLDRFSMFHIPEAFDIEAFYVYMKKNRHTCFILDFGDSISEEYKNRLEEIVDEILGTEALNYKPPGIRFPGLSIEKDFEFLVTFEHLFFP